MLIARDRNPPAVDAHDRPLRRDRREIPDDLAAPSERRRSGAASAGVVQRASALARRALKDSPPRSRLVGGGAL